MIDAVLPSPNRTHIQWCNHASFMVHHDPISLLVDPWFTGSVFEHGWDLLCETPVQDLSAVTDVWVSHEHPDHFHPPTLRSIPPEQRAQMRFWFRATRDGKVAGYARALGFAEVSECRVGTQYELGPGVRLQVEPWELFDSFAVIRTPDSVIVDLNDCKTRGAWSAHRLARRLRDVPVDVLITQVEAGDDVQMLVEQVRALKPRVVVPGASFVWFSHAENAQHNAGISRIDRAWRRLRNAVDADVVILYPGDDWIIGAPHDSLGALERYRADYDRLATGREFHDSSPVAREQLRLNAALWGARLRSVNGKRMLSGLERLGALPSTAIWVTDLGEGFTLSARGLEPSSTSAAACDVALTSSALDSVFRLPWGGNTLSVNGRVAFPAGGSAQRFRRWMAISSYNNHGYRIGQVLPRLAREAVQRRLATSHTAEVTS